MADRREAQLADSSADLLAEPSAADSPYFSVAAAPAVETVGRLYFQRGNHKDLATKKIMYFNEFVRTHFYVHSVQANDTDLKEHLASKTGIDQAEIEILLRYIQWIEENETVNDDMLAKLNSKIESFYTQLNNYGRK